MNNHPYQAPVSNGQRASLPAAQPPKYTNAVTTREGKTLRAKIDPSVSASEVVHQLCLVLQYTDSWRLFSLRTESDELVTDENLGRVVREKTPLKLTNGPLKEATEIVGKLRSPDRSGVRIALRDLRKYIKEEEFSREFLKRDGLRELLDIIMTSQGNVLSAALIAMDNLMESEKGWESLPLNFIERIVYIITTETSINICRPATSILKRLVEADPRSRPIPGPSTSKAPPQRMRGTVYNYGFDIVFDQTRSRPAFLENVVQRLSSPESLTALNSLRLINALISSATDDHWEEFMRHLDQLNVKKAVIRLMDSHQGDDLTSSILDFQANMIRAAYRRKITPVDPQHNESHREMLNRIWLTAELPLGENGEKWTRLGFESEDMKSEFSRVGVLGLECLHALATSTQDSEYFPKVILEQANRAEERRCPFARASNEVVELLCEHWAVFSGYASTTSYQPWFLAFQQVHNLTTRFFLRMWNESSAALYDFPRVAALVRSQVKVALRNESTAKWYELEKEMLESEYHKVRERQMKELELEDDLLNKPPIRNLRERLYTESFNFVRDQRVQCLMDGAWFVNAVPVTGTNKAVERPSRPWRFLRLDKTKKFLHYVDSTVKTQIRSGMEDLPERIEVAQITEVAIHTGVAAPGLLPTSSPELGYSTALAAHPWSFSLMSMQGSSPQGFSLADQVAESASTFSDWIDGLNMLRKEGGVARKETHDIVTALTEIGLKIKLLDLTGEKIDIPATIPYQPPPDNMDFFFSDP